MIFSKKPKFAYILAIRKEPDWSTLVLDYGNKPAIYFPFKHEEDLRMTLDVLKTAGIKIGKTETVDIDV